MARSTLSKHFLQNFFYSQEPLVIMGGRLYTLSRTNGNFNGHDALHFLGRNYALDESEEVSQLEHELFTANQPDIERAMTRYIQRNFLDKIESAKSQLEKKQNYYESMQDATIERFIMVDVFNEYNHENRGDINKIETSKWDNIPELERLPSAADLVSRQNSLDPLVNSYGFTAIGNKCYTLYENGSSRDEDKGYVVFNGKVLALKPWMQLEELCSMYTRNLIERINNKAAEHGKQYAEILSEMNRQRRELDKGVNEIKSISGKENARRGEIGFRKLSVGQYEISVTLEPYIIEKNGNYYAFGSVKLGMVLKAKGNEIMIDDAPHVLNMPYLHPFVWGNSKICYGKLDWKKQRGVRFGHGYDLSNRKGIAKRVAEAMREGKRTLEKGYIGDVKTDFTPVHNIGSCNCKIADSREDAKRYARNHGIKLERVIKNE